MQQWITTRALAMAAAMLVALASPAATAEIGGIEGDSPLVDFLLSDGMTREELADLYRTLAVGQFEPPDCVAGEEMFDDVPASNTFCPWIEELARRGITGGCNSDNYCPGNPVSRAQMAVFVVQAIQAAADAPGIALAGVRINVTGGNHITHWFNREGGAPELLTSSPCGSGQCTFRVRFPGIDDITDLIGQATPTGSNPGMASSGFQQPDIHLIHTRSADGDPQFRNVSYVVYAAPRQLLKIED